VPVTLDETAQKILDGRNFATIATLNADGSPQTSVVWVKRDGDSVLFTVTTVRRKARNLARDPRVSLSVFDLDNPYTAVDIAGTAELVPDPDRALSHELSHKYLGTDPPPAGPDELRLIVRVTPEKVTGFAATTG
jgi:PPOX class probable F420-dependent enzyme